jgi:subtilase family serine protease
VNGSVKLLAPLVAALAMAACNGGSSTTPGTAGTYGAGDSVFSPSHHIPQWQAQNLAHPACPQVVGQATCLALISNRVTPLTTPSGFTAADLQTRYNLPSSTKGSGQIVAIVDAYDNPNVAKDLAQYRKQFGLGKAIFTKYNEEGKKKDYPAGSMGWGVEIDLDTQMVSAACPKCTIYLIEADSNSTTDLETSEKEAVKLGAHIVSNSYICYASTCGFSDSYYDTKKVLYLASSGDEGYNENGPPEWFPTVVSVGGTQLELVGKTYSEIIWDGAGGGCSSNGGSAGQTKPSWQTDPDCTFRTDADVSAQAGLDPGVAEYDTYLPSSEAGWFQVGGTSVASPLTAGVFALAGNASSQNAAENFWKLSTKTRAKELHYISAGNDGNCNGDYLCTAGSKQYGTYSGPGGWGTPNGIKAY